MSKKILKARGKCSNNLFNRRQFTELSKVYNVIFLIKFFFVKNV